MQERLRLRVFGTPAQLAAVRPELDEQFRRWAPLWRPPADVDLRHHFALPELLGHVLALGSLERDDGDRPIEFAGCATSTAEAITACVGELVERVAARRWRPDGVRATAAELAAAGEPVLDVPGVIGRPVFPARWPFPDYTPDRPLTWTRGTAVDDGRPVWIPEALIALRDVPSDGRLSEITTIGLAAGRDPASAVRHATAELLERDAVMRVWAGEAHFTPIDGIPPEIAEALERDARLGWTTEPLQTTALTGRPVAAVLTRRPSTYSFGIGFSAHDDPAQRLRHALAEAVQVRLLAALYGNRRVDDVTTFQDHLLYYCNPDRFALLDRLTHDDGRGRGGGRVASPPAAPGMSAAWVRLDGEDDGPSVVRVVAPGLHHMEVRSSCARTPLPPSAPTGDYLPHPYP
ncbi:YcaO-like family protein [Actinomadura sp. 3N508]|uniref:YcaO-like family protein n=1 Tax=Actinomadura sp. 3N508 TaxID=3375153 RepID=UPI0037A82B53